MPTAIAAVAGVIGSGLFAAGASLAVVNAVTLVIVPALIKIGIGLAISVVSTALLQRKQPPVTPTDGQQTIRQVIVPRRKSFGRVRVAGAVWWVSTDPNQPNTLHYGLVFNHGRCSQIVQQYLDRNAIKVDGSDEVITEPYTNGGVFLYTNLGAATETAYSAISSRFGIDNCRGDGLMTCLLEAQSRPNAEVQLEVWPNGIPEVHMLLDASVVYDPREAAHDRADETTWEYSDNPLVCLFHYLFVDADGYGIDYERVADNLPEWIAAMNVCDEAVTLDAGGTEKRYRLAMSFNLTEDPVEVAARMLAACDGKIWPRRDGQIGVSVGKYVAPTVIIASRDILSYSEMTRGQGKLAKVAGVRARYMSPDHDYTEQDAEAWPDGSTVAALSEDRTLSVDLTMAPSMTQARRLMKRIYIRNRPSWRGTIVTNLAGLQAMDERTVWVRIDELGINESFEIANFQFDPVNMQCVLDVLSLDETIDAWDETSEEGTPPANDPLTPLFIDPNDHTVFSDFGSDDIDAFDGDTTQTASQSASKTISGSSATGYIGLTLATASPVIFARVYASSDQGFVEQTTGEPNVTLQLYGKTGSAPASSTDGTQLASTGSFTDANSLIKDLWSDDRGTEWDHVWIRITVAGANLDNFHIAEIEFYK